jgi:chromosome segregation protein
MVHIKRVELSHFKSFGGTTAVPLLPGFTVISGPNGSGKSNILDALLFCLGLATSKGMRAERLPDLVNNSHSQQRNVAETQVSVTFDLSDLGEAETEWTISRRLRVAKTGTYTSTYYINSQPCTVNELHEQLSRLHIYPEGYNVVLQGDVTRIITMNSKERREIIDELAGVAEFDRKIAKTKETLEEVREREERCQIIVQELVRVLERLAGDRTKAEKYQKLKSQSQGKQILETLLRRRWLSSQIQHLEQQIDLAREQQTQLTSKLTQTSQSLEELNRQVKALGEEEQLSLASQKARQQAQCQQLKQRQVELNQTQKEQEDTKKRLDAEIIALQTNLTQIDEKYLQISPQVPTYQEQLATARENLEAQRAAAREIAATSEAWVAQQSQLSQNINALQNQLNPQLREQAQLRERLSQLQTNLQQHSQQREISTTELNSQVGAEEKLRTTLEQAQEKQKNLAQQLSLAEQAKLIHQDTQKRLLKEQRDKQRELDKLEARQQAQQEAQGSYASQVILNSDLPGVCGLVAQLAEVESRYQLALEIAAGARLGQIVVEDDSIAAAGIALLKQRQVGRATFLPLNKINPPRPQDIHSLRSARGFIDLAVRLVRCAPRYEKIFAYVFGNTLVFEDLDSARLHLGKHRLVTLAGDLLETSGAMTGGSQPSRAGIHFGQTNPKDSQEVNEIKQRLGDIEQILARNEQLLAERISQVDKLTQEVNETKQITRESQLKLEQLERDIKRLAEQKDSLESQIEQQQKDLVRAEERLEKLGQEIPLRESQLLEEQEKLRELEQSNTHSEWQQIQGVIQEQEKLVQQQESLLRQSEVQLQDLGLQKEKSAEKLMQTQARLEELNGQRDSYEQQQEGLILEIEELERKIQETDILLQEILQKLGETKINRDNQEKHLKSLENEHQQMTWQLEKLQSSYAEKQNQIAEVMEREIPEFIPEEVGEALQNAPEELGEFLDKLQQEIRQIQKRLEAMEPVNMLALEEYEKNQERLTELAEKLQTLEGERTELLLRVENFTSLRYRAFKEAFDAVNENFQSIFSALSDGDGYLQLEDPSDPFQGGLTLVAHPKGKPVQRLSSMSGGEKSLTALSFIFALQRYRPSPFYAFDEVDMFLDGANVEKLSKMIRSCAEEAQFIVVSLRRPMIEASQRTIGVTQARGAYTQVLGIKV